MIDEVSMVSSVVLAQVDQRLKEWCVGEAKGGGGEESEGGAGYIYKLPINRLCRRYW